MNSIDRDQMSFVKLMSLDARVLFLTRFILVLIALHAPSWMVAIVYRAPIAEERPLLNLDLLFAATLASVSTIAGGVVLLLAWAADFVRAAAKNYHFMSAFDMMDAVRFVDMLDLSTFMSPLLVAAVLGLVLCAWVILKSTRQEPRLLAALLATAVLSVGGDLANGSFHILGLDKDRRIFSMNLAGSPTWNIWRATRQSLLASGMPAPMQDAKSFQALQAWHAMNPGQTSILVLVESLGLPNAPKLQVWLHDRLAGQVAPRWTVHQSDEPFRGTTTSGELRALCGLQGHYSRLDDKFTISCLPKMLAEKGAVSIGIHGFGLRMFDRNQWWPRIGLKPWQWPDLKRAHLPMACNQAFPGICDSAVFDVAVDLAQRPAHFIYALTLDTHLPLMRSSSALLPADLKVLCNESGTPEEACHLLGRLGEVLSHLGDSLARSRATPFVVVVGDHAPPFGEISNRQAFAAGRVPLFLLMPVEPHGR